MSTPVARTNDKAEAEALKKAVTEIGSNLPRTQQKIVIFTDALSVLQALQSPRKELNELASALATLCTQADVTLQWIPAHCGVKGNETATELIMGRGP